MRNELLINPTLPSYSTWLPHSFKTLSYLSYVCVALSSLSLFLSLTLGGIWLWVVTSHFLFLSFPLYASYSDPGVCTQPVVCEGHFSATELHAQIVILSVPSQGQPPFVSSLSSKRHALYPRGGWSPLRSPCVCLSSLSLSRTVSVSLHTLFRIFSNFKNRISFFYHTTIELKTKIINGNKMKLHSPIVGNFNNCLVTEK